MDEEITAFQFDAALAETCSATDDGTVRAIGRALWFCYDDCKDHRIVASREEWAFFYRLLLLLESGGEMETVRSWRTWHPLQVVAALLFLAFLVVGARAGPGQHLLAYALPFGPPSMLLAWLNSRRHRRALSKGEAALAPFPSVRSLLSARRRVRGFMRRRCPDAVVGRTVRDPIIDKLMWVPWSIAWCMFSPVALFFQMLPDTDSETRIRLPEPLAGVCASPRVAQP
jgi:hypothetical protein